MQMAINGALISISFFITLSPFPKPNLIRPHSLPLGPTFSLLMTSISLPGVAHSTLQPWVICRTECPNWVPPYMTTALTQVLLTRKNRLFSSYLKIRHISNKMKRQNP